MLYYNHYNICITFTFKYKIEIVPVQKTEYVKYFIYIVLLPGYGTREHSNLRIRASNGGDCSGRNEVATVERKRQGEGFQGWTGGGGVPWILFGPRLAMAFVTDSVRRDLIIDLYLSVGITPSRRDGEPVGRKGMDGWVSCHGGRPRL